MRLTKNNTEDDCRPTSLRKPGKNCDEWIVGLLACLGYPKHTGIVRAYPPILLSEAKAKEDDSLVDLSTVSSRAEPHGS